MTSRDEDDAWRAIVENYGDRPSLDADRPAPEPEPLPDDDFDPYTFPEPPPDPEPERDVLDDDDRFVPEPPPAPPVLEPRRRAAWGAVLGAPVLLFLVALIGWEPPSVVSYLLVACFVVGFGYLVSTMPRGPRDPWDDGAQV